MAKANLFYRDQQDILYRTVITAYDVGTGEKKQVLCRVDDGMMLIIPADDLFKSVLDEEQNPVFLYTQDFNAQAENDATWRKTPPYAGDTPGDTRSYSPMRKGGEIRGTWSHPNRTR